MVKIFCNQFNKKLNRKTGRVITGILKISVLRK